MIHVIFIILYFVDLYNVVLLLGTGSALAVKMSITSDWHPLGDVFFRKFELYSMQWRDSVDLSKYTICAAAYGGPIALARCELKSAKTGLAPKPIIYIFTSSGSEMANIRWNSGNLLKMGWSCVEDLVCVQDDGSVLVYDIFGSFKKTFTMGQEAKDVKIIQCHIFNTFSGGTGVAVLTSSYRIFIVNNIDDIRLRRLAEVQGIDAPPSCWSVISTSAHTRVLLAREADLYLLDSGGLCDKQMVPVTGDVESYIEIAISFNHKYLALFTSSGILWIGSSDLQHVYCEFDTKCHTRPLQLVWCGPGAVVGYWDGIMLMVGSKKDWIKFSYDSAVTMVPEMDGVRIIGSTSHEFLQKVPTVVEDIFKIGSISPGAMLYEAAQEFQKGSQRTDEYIRMIKERLGDAVKQCIEAAAHEFEPSMQKSLLRAAAFGKCFLTDFNSQSFVSICQQLRVLNAIRGHRIGIPITYVQLEHMKISVVIDRLVMRRKYWLAVAICQYLKIPDMEGSSRVLAHWACYKIKQSDYDEEQLALTLAQKLGNTPGVSYSEVANYAIERGKTDLAIRLLNFEPRAAEQVPLLMKMKKFNLALTKAVESGDTDLVYMVILHLNERLQLGEFLMAIRTIPVAYALYLQYCREGNRQMLLDLYYQEDRHLDEGNCHLVNSYDEERLDARLRMLVAAQEAYNKSKNECALKSTEEQIKLMKYQQRLEEEFNKPFLDQSLHQTIFQLTVSNNHKLVEQMRKEFKIPDRRFWWLKILALAENNDWSELDRFSKLKKSPIGYEPFFEVCVNKGNMAEAQKYLVKVSSENLVKCHIRMGQLDQAADLAFQNRNEDELNLVLSKCTSANRILADRINSMKLQLSSKP